MVYELCDEIKLFFHECRRHLTVRIQSMKYEAQETPGGARTPLHRRRLNTSSDIMTL